MLYSISGRLAFPPPPGSLFRLPETAPPFPRKPASPSPERKGLPNRGSVNRGSQGALSR
ncbi:MAG: hypothetical protein LBR53_06995 [Deltaproteobacteria bacterium]|nr:hypothetical protein [Deltaproteobacteria bacterium]